MPVISVTAGSPSARTTQARRLWLYAAALFTLLALFAPLRAAGSTADKPADKLADAAALESAFQEVVERVGPTVVSLRVRRRHLVRSTVAEAQAESGLLEQVVLVNGTAMVVSRDGLILTNEHVIQSASQIDVTLSNGERWPATVVASDARSDLAILKIERDGLSPVKFATWSGVRRGQWTLAIGNPYGLGNDGHASLSVGVISNLHRRLPGLGEVDDRFYGDMIQTTAQINPGNSGGPLFNLRGEVIGLITAMHTRAGQADGIGFCIPLTPTKRKLIAKLMRGEEIVYGFAGLAVRELEAAERASGSAPENVGVKIVQIEAGGPADSAGLRVGDIILKYNGRFVRRSADLAERIGLSKIGDKGVFNLRRGDVTLDVVVTIARRDGGRVSWMRSGAMVWRGMRIANLTAESRALMSVAAGAKGVVVIDVEADTPASRAKIEIGNVIEAVSGHEIPNITAFQQHVGTDRGPVEIFLRDAGQRVISP